MPHDIIRVEIDATPMVVEVMLQDAAFSHVCEHMRACKEDMCIEVMCRNCTTCECVMQAGERDTTKHVHVYLGLCACACDQTLTCTVCMCT